MASAVSLGVRDERKGVCEMMLERLEEWSEKNCFRRVGSREKLNSSS